MLQKVEKSILDNRLISPGDRVLCAVSGGADSVALLIMLQQLSGKLRFTLQAAHLDHQLRAESKADAEFVIDLCTELSIPLVSETENVQTLSVARGEGLEAAGRYARRSFLERVASKSGCRTIALAHHADDQAETVLFRLLRGSGLTGLAAMRARSGVYIRPLLPFRKSELCEWLVTNGIAWREDASNQDARFSRNLIRNQILPGLRQINEQVIGALCRFSSQVAEEEDYWQDQVTGFLQQNLTQDEDSLSVSIDLLQRLHPALRRRVLRGMLKHLNGDLPQVNACHIDQIELLLTGSKAQSETLLPDTWVARRYDLLQMRPSPPDFAPFELTILRDGSYPLPNGERLVVSHQRSPSLGTGSVEFCSGKVSFPLTVRTVHMGDRFQPSGMTGHKSLKNYFIDNKIPRERRHSTLVVCAGGTIIWIVGERRCEGLLPDFSNQVLQIRVERAVFVDE